MRVVGNKKCKVHPTDKLVVAKSRADTIGIVMQWCVVAWNMGMDLMVVGGDDSGAAKDWCKVGLGFMFGFGHSDEDSN